MGRMVDMDLSDGDGRPTPNRRSEADGPRRPARAPRPRGLRGLLDRERIVGAIKTFAWLAPLTVGIWVYAEREQVVYPLAFNASAQVKVMTTAANRYVELVDPAPPAMVQLKLSGPQEQVYTVKSELDAQGLTLDLAARGPGNAQKVNIVAAAQDMPIFRTAGVTVTEAEPAEVTVNVDSVEERSAVVEVDPNSKSAGLVSGTPVFTPPRVTLRGPKSEMDDLERAEKPADGKLRVYADLSSFDLGEPGERPLQAVPLTLPLGKRHDVTCEPAQVQAKLQVRAADVTYVIKSVLVEVDISPRVLQDYDVTVNDGNDPTIPNLHVTGPADKIADLQPLNGQPPRATVVAHVEVQREDFNHDGPRPLTFTGLPEGVKVAPEDVGRTVTLKMTSRGGGT